MADRFTLTQAARLIGVTPRILTLWLHDAGVSTHKGEKAAGEDARAQYVTRTQVAMLAAAHGRILPDDTSLAALAGQIGQMQGEIDALKRRVATLESKQGHQTPRNQQPSPALLQAQSEGISPDDEAPTQKRPRV